MSSTQDLRSQSPITQTLRGLDVQANVIGALILRELHTRFGRDNIGYLWIIVEPMLLAASVAAIHMGSKTHFGLEIRPVPFALGGYCVFILFRSIVTRAEAALRANQTLLYHRSISIFDILFARALLEFVSTVAAFAILLGGAWALGLAELPARPLVMLAATGLMLWWSFALSLLVSAGAHFSPLVEQFLHPVTYVLLPLSGAFFMLKWIPNPYRDWLSWFPMTEIIEQFRYGQFASFDDRYVRVPYIIGWCLVLTYLGLIAIKITRRHVHLS